jgi:hypothetical protein
MVESSGNFHTLLHEMSGIIIICSLKDTLLCTHLVFSCKAASNEKYIEIIVHLQNVGQILTPPFFQDVFL